jgi:hypothetical protein
MYASLSKPQDQLELKEVGIRHKKTWRLLSNCELKIKSSIKVNPA